MKRFVIALALIAAPLSAQASTQLASDWGSKAASLHDQTTDFIAAMDQGSQSDLPLDYVIEIERFSVTAANLGGWIDAGNGTADLGCIFRGIAAEGERQLTTLDVTTDQSEKREALRRLATVFADAEMIAAASTHRRMVPPGAAHAVCPADPTIMLSALH